MIKLSLRRYLESSREDEEKLSKSRISEGFFYDALRYKIRAELFEGLLLILSKVEPPILEQTISFPEFVEVKEK